MFVFKRVLGLVLFSTFAEVYFSSAFPCFTVPLQANGTPTRTRRPFNLAGMDMNTNCSTHSKQAEIEARLQEIIKLTGIITVDGRKYHTSIHDLEHLGELGFGSCGHVVKMRHPPTGAIIAVKVCYAFHIYYNLLCNVFLTLANAAVRQSRRKQAYHHGSRSRAQITRLPVHRTMYGLLCHGVRRVDLHGAHGHML